MQAFEVRGCEGKGFWLNISDFYPQLLLRRLGFFMGKCQKFYLKLKHLISVNRTLVFLLVIVNCQLSIVNYSFAGAPVRIISLAPSITEILFAAGLEDNIAGVTTYCDYPEKAKEKPEIGGMSNPSLEAVVRLQPDIVIMTTDGNPKEFEQRLHLLNIRTYVFRSRRLSELPDGIKKLGIELDEKDKFNALALNIERAMARGKARFEAAQESKVRGKVLFVVWPEPLIVAGPGTAINDAINLLGGINIAEDTKSRYPKYSIEEIIRRSPDIIFFGRGKGMDKISKKLLKRLTSVPAIKNNKVFFVSDNLYRLGPRVIDGLEELEGYFVSNTDNH